MSNPKKTNKEEVSLLEMIGGSAIGILLGIGYVAVFLIYGFSNVPVGLFLDTGLDGFQSLECCRYERQINMLGCIMVALPFLFIGGVIVFDIIRSKNQKEEKIEEKEPTNEV